MSDPYRTNLAPKTIPRKSFRWAIYALAFIFGGGLFSSTGSTIYAWLKAPKQCVTSITYPAANQGCTSTYACPPNASMEILNGPGLNGVVICKCKEL